MGFTDELSNIEEQLGDGAAVSGNSEFLDGLRLVEGLFAISDRTRSRETSSMSVSSLSQS